MSRDSDHHRILSLKLSEVLSDIGINDGMVLKRRRLIMLRETITSSTNRFLGKSKVTYLFGSQSEGSTTIGLSSDTDVLSYLSTCNVIQDWGEWQLGNFNLLMVQDDTTSPGYCHLEILCDDEPLPLPRSSCCKFVPDRYLTVRRGKVLLKNTYRTDMASGGGEMSGPAATRKLLGYTDRDFVPALHCRSWPVEARPWLKTQGIGGWPTKEMKRYCETTGCFVVPVSSKSGRHEDLEWRISTSKAERCLMFNLNITQLSCYVLMKMILKTFINPKCDDVLSSFMCKTVLFHCVHTTPSTNWLQPNLLSCLICCLKKLQNFVRKGNCPHFITQGNNLMAGRISAQNKDKILEILQNIIQSGGLALLEIPIDDLGTRLEVKMNMRGTFQYCGSPTQIHNTISTGLLRSISTIVSVSHKYILSHIMRAGNDMAQKRISDFLYTLTRTYRENGFNNLEKSAYRLLTPLLSSSLGSMMASHDIYTTRSISPKTLAWFSLVSKSDVSSGRLKLASAFYCVGDMEMAEFVLSTTEENYHRSIVEPSCGCHRYQRSNPQPRFMNKCNTGNEEIVKNITAFCVRFLQCEINCVPKELQYEIFKSTPGDKLERDENDDCWMDWAVVDSLPYLHFLQYKTYRALHRVGDQQRALAKLITSIDTEPNLAHRETALNLLGQCMEQESRHNDAIHYYMRSLNIRAQNNVAKVLICRLVSALINAKK